MMTTELAGWGLSRSQWFWPQGCGAVAGSTPGPAERRVRRHQGRSNAVDDLKTVSLGIEYSVMSAKLGETQRGSMKQRRMP